jgi:hypothetical protein
VELNLLQVSLCLISEVLKGLNLSTHLLLCDGAVRFTLKVGGTKVVHIAVELIMAEPTLGIDIVLQSVFPCSMEDGGVVHCTHTHLTIFAHREGEHIGYLLEVVVVSKRHHYRLASINHLPAACAQRGVNTKVLVHRINYFVLLHIRMGGLNHRPPLQQVQRCFRMLHQQLHLLRSQRHHQGFVGWLL